MGRSTAGAGARSQPARAGEAAGRGHRDATAGGAGCPGRGRDATAGDAGRSGPAQAPAPADTPTFPTQLEQVIVDVVVTDKKGTPIKGLTAADLTVTEDGVKQDVVTFEAVELPEQPSAAAPPPPKVSSNTAPEEQRARTFVVVFDDMHITPYRANQAKVAVASFLEKGTREGDRVSLISTAGATWWTTRMEAGRQKLVDIVKTFDGRLIPDHSPERMSDYEALRIHIYRDPTVVERVLRRYDTYGVTQQNSRSNSGADSMRVGTSDDPYVSGRAAEVYFQAATRMRTTLDVMERALNGLAGAKGRKSLILVSEGFIHDINLDEFKRVGNAARRANTAIYFVNARGLEGVPVAMTAAVRPGAARAGRGLRLRGELRRGGGLGGGLERQRRLHRPQHQRPQQGHPAHRRRDARLLPDGLRADEHGARRQVPQDPGQAREQQGPRHPRAQGLLRSRRDGQERAHRQEGRRPRGAERARLALVARRDPAAHDALHRRRALARQGRGADHDRGGHPRARPLGGRGPQRRRAAVPAGGRAPRERRVLPLRPGHLDEDAAGDPRALQPLLVPGHARLRAEERRLPGQDRGARRAQQAHRHPDPRVRRAAARHAARLDARC